jgi:hypothetical protein
MAILSVNVTHVGGRLGEIARFFAAQHKDLP